MLSASTNDDFAFSWVKFIQNTYIICFLFTLTLMCLNFTYKNFNAPSDWVLKCLRFGFHFDSLGWCFWAQRKLWFLKLVANWGLIGSATDINKFLIYFFLASSSISLTTPASPGTQIDLFLSNCFDFEWLLSQESN